MVKAARSFPGDFALYVKDLNSGVAYSYNGDTPMYLASGVKIMMMAALFDALAEHKVKMEQALRFEQKDLRDGSPIFGYFKPGDTVPLRLALKAMIQNSDNTATDMVFGLLEPDAVAKTLRKERILGFGPVTSLLDVRRLVYERVDPDASKLSNEEVFELQITRPYRARMVLLAELLGHPAGRYGVRDYVRAYREYYEAGYNSASMRSVGVLLERLARGRLISRSASRTMLKIMKGTKTGTHRIRAGLPDHVELAHKTGTQYRRTVDLGIIYMSRRRPVVFAVSVEGARRRQAEALIADLTERAYYWLATPAQRRALKPKRVRVPISDDTDDADPDDPPLDKDEAGALLSVPGATPPAESQPSKTPRSDAEPSDDATKPESKVQVPLSPGAKALSPLLWPDSNASDDPEAKSPAKSKAKSGKNAKKRRRSFDRPL